MAISTSLRNKLVGFIIVASTILIFLPVLLSKDMIKKDAPDNNAVAITQNGALRDANGNLVPQGQPNVDQALNISGQNNALVLTGQAPQRGPQPELNPNLAANSNVANDNSVEMLEFSRPQAQNSRPPQALGPAPLPSNKQPEILEAKPKPQNQAKQPEILTAKNKPAATNNKPASKPAATSNSSSSASGTKVIAGSKPSERFVIQVGVFAKRSNADNVVAKIKKAGISVYAIEVASNNKVLYRVYAGHANSRSALNAQVAQIDKLCGTKSKIVSI
ncbi:MAG TPA: SPOR domain-containing protein [Candidatus Anaerobiospirillum pullistercoris]|uniref:SPOR domain-containing protein n=1 Tax=Candidatus Anaerobiospirillum pullistercoris TaxID=2838452 RepID=A0A9D1WDA0_9GAMM|nr:SPOR domain-containing protein [Candidatus Anaerobiospirillum pullistercoris]